MPTGKIIEKNLNISPPIPIFLTAYLVNAGVPQNLFFLKCLFFHIYMFTKIKNKEKI